MSPNKIIIVSAHPDDFELGMAMRIRKYADEGSEITAVTATNGEYSSTPMGRFHEEQRAAKILGIKNLVNLALPCAQLSENIYPLRLELEKLVKQIKPDVGYTVYPDRFHVDHEVVSHQSLIWPSFNKPSADRLT